MDVERTGDAVVVPKWYKVFGPYRARLQIKLADGDHKEAIQPVDEFVVWLRENLRNKASVTTYRDDLGDRYGLQRKAHKSWVDIEFVDHRDAIAFKLTFDYPSESLPPGKKII